MARVNQKQIAAELGVAQITVSRALRNDPAIAVRTRERVQETAARLGYRPNLLARSLVTGRTNILGILLPTYRMLFYGTLLETIERLAAERHLRLLLSKWGPGQETDRDNVESLTAFQADGLIVQAREQPGLEAIYAPLLKRGLPIVFLRPMDLDGASSAWSDDDSGTAAAVEHLVGYGHRRIGFVAMTSGGSIEAGREDGYRRALVAAGLAADPAWLVPEHPEHLHHELDRVLALDTPPTAFCAARDGGALTLIEALRERGLRVPEDISVVGFGNDLPFPDHLAVPLTTVDQHPDQLAALAMQMLDELLAGDRDPRHEECPVTLIPRASVAPPPTT